MRSDWALQELLKIVRILLRGTQPFWSHPTIQPFEKGITDDLGEAAVLKAVGVENHVAVGETVGRETHGNMKGVGQIMGGSGGERSI